MSIAKQNISRRGVFESGSAYSLSSMFGAMGVSAPCTLGNRSKRLFVGSFTTQITNRMIRVPLSFVEVMIANQWGAIACVVEYDTARIDCLCFEQDATLADLEVRMNDLPPSPLRHVYFHLDYLTAEFCSCPSELEISLPRKPWTVGIDLTFKEAVLVGRGRSFQILHEQHRSDCGRIIHTTGTG